ncbi:MAG: hypothetical protein RI964_2885 [Pseudomonadota bacterium]|jgi:hypothetical protein
MKYGPIFWGGVGGILPNVVQKAQELLKSSPDTAVDSIIYPTFLIGVALVACIGGIIVAAFQEQDNRKALFLGISAPALIMVMASAPMQNNPTPAVNMQQKAAPMSQQQSFIPSLVSTAYADDVPVSAASRTTNRFVEVFADDTSETFQIDFLSADNKVVQSQALSLPVLAMKLAIPATATGVRFTKDGNESEHYILPTSTNAYPQEFSVNVKKGRAYGFWAALGVAPAVEYQFTVKQDDVKPAPVGVEAWARAGDFDGKQWSGKFFNFTTGKLPVVGEKFAVVYPVNLRSDANISSERVGELRLEQQVEIIDIKANDANNYWVRIKVLH